MSVNVESAEEAAEVAYMALRLGKGCQFRLMPSGTVFWMVNASVFSDGQAGLYVSCSIGGAVVIDNLAFLTVMGLVKHKFNLGTATFVFNVIKRMVIIDRESTQRTTVNLERGKYHDATTATNTTNTKSARKTRGPSKPTTGARRGRKRRVDA